MNSHYTPQRSAGSRRKKYRGGFSTSVCDLFSNPSNRSDCCAITCCGLFVSDRTHYMVMGTMPPPWWKRIMINIVAPLLFLVGLFVVLLLSRGVSIDSDTSPTQTPAYGSYESSYNNSSSQQGQEAASDVILTMIIFSVIVLCALLVRGQYLRVPVRRAIVQRLQEARRQQSESGTVSDQGLALQSYSYDLDRPHHNCPCMCCLSDDTFYDLVGIDEDDETEAESSLPDDFCTRLWNLSRYLCCGCCGCWFQCCGMCAVGQEDREMSFVLSKKDFQIDYVTFEPYKDYYDQIIVLRNTHEKSFRAHVKALSRLSRKLIRMFGVTLVVLAILAVFQPATVLLVLATFFQAFLILYLVQWRWNRFDLSFDAVVKYFSSGFIISIGLAMSYELLVQLILSVVALVAVIATAIINPGVIPDNDDNEGDSGKDFVSHHMALLEMLAGIAAFVNAFVVAALVEELSKYFSFWMVEHPDFIQEDVSAEESNDNDIDHDNKIMNDRESEEEEDPQVHEHEEQQQTIEDPLAATPTSTISSSEASSQRDYNDNRSLTSKGAATTVAMVATALGFACCENLEYVFGSSKPGIKNEFITLAFRSLFAIHPIAAAMQSIGVVRRDLEGNRSVGIGRIILPAFLLHGTFDFILMFFSSWEGIHFVKDEPDDPDAARQYIKDIEERSIWADWPLYIVCLVVEGIGIIYYVVEARAQRKRLEDLNNSHGRQNGPYHMV